MCFVVTKIFCCNKHNFVVTKVLLRQAYFCLDIRCVLLWQNIVTTKMILVAVLPVVSLSMAGSLSGHLDMEDNCNNSGPLHGLSSLDFFAPFD